MLILINIVLAESNGSFLLLLFPYILMNEWAVNSLTVRVNSFNPFYNSSDKRVNFLKCPGVPKDLTFYLNDNLIAFRIQMPFIVLVV